MSGLSLLLAGERSAGVYRWNGEEPTEQVRQACVDAGAGFGVLDGVSRPGKAGLLAELARALDFPDWFGHNYDALADCLADLTTPVVLLWDGWGALATEEPQSFVMALDVLEGRTTHPPAFAVLLRGAGPEIDPPWL